MLKKNYSCFLQKGGKLWKIRKMFNQLHYNYEYLNCAEFHPEHEFSQILVIGQFLIKLSAEKHKSQIELF